MQWHSGDCDEPVEGRMKVYPHCGAKFGFLGSFKVWGSRPKVYIWICKFAFILGILLLVGLIAWIDGQQ
jgi:hypothetical protein